MKERTMAQVENEACCKDDGDDVWIVSCHLSASTLLVLCLKVYKRHRR